MTFPSRDAALAQAVALRAGGKLEEARERLIALAGEHPDDAEIAYQTAWAHDASGLEAEAVQYYERALELPGLSGSERQDAYTGLGSTYRVLGRFSDAIATFDRGLAEFPGDGAMQTFRAIALYNAGEAREAVRALLLLLLEAGGDNRVAAYRRALTYYADHLDETA